MRARMTRLAAWIAASCLTSTVAGAAEDFGDAPESYHTLLSTNGPRHTIGLPIFGSWCDSDPDGRPSPNADGDDTDGATFDDEDGVLFVTPLRPGAAASLKVDVTRDSQLAAKMNAWVDFSGNGTFADPEDQIFTDQPMAPGVNELPFTVAASAAVGSTFARFRVSYQGGDSFEGAGGAGEVEDHAVAIEAPTATERGTWGRMKASYRPTAH